MGRIRKSLAWALSPGGSGHGLVRPQSSAEKAAGQQSALLAEQNRLLGGTAPAASAVKGAGSGRDLTEEELTKLPPAYRDTMQPRERKRR
jgi:hypothetical protein